MSDQRDTTAESQAELIDDEDTLSSSSDDSSDSASDEISVPCTMTGRTVFVVMLDDTPLYYTQSLADARAMMWTDARMARTYYSDTYATSIVEKSTPDSVTVIGTQKNVIYSVDRTLHVFRVCLVQEICVPPPASTAASVEQTADPGRITTVSTQRAVADNSDASTGRITSFFMRYIMGCDS